MFTTSFLYTEFDLYCCSSKFQSIAQLIAPYIKIKNIVIKILHMTNVYNL